MDTSTLIVVFLLVTAASLASYALSHWSSIRGALNLSWAATSLGTTMLLIAAAIVVLTFVFRGPLWRPNLGVEQPMHERAAAPEETPARRLDASLVSPGAAAPTQAATSSQTARSSRDRHIEDDSAATMASEPQAASKAATTPSGTKLSSSFLGAYKDDDPWAATRCVSVYNPGSDPMQWKIENDCDLPVGIVVSICAKDGQHCVPAPQLIFPAKRQRPITLEEQTVVGYSVRHMACFVATAEAVYFIGARSEERATDAWREQFEAARTSDSCLLRLQN
jgi:hypothetical protein